MSIPELKQEGAGLSYNVPANCLNWALEYAFGLGKDYANVGPDTASRMVVQSMAGRNMIRIVHSHWVGLTEHVDSVKTLKADEHNQHNDEVKA